jgi:hypothetical protein
VLPATGFDVLFSIFGAYFLLVSDFLVSVFCTFLLSIVYCLLAAFAG